MCILYAFLGLSLMQNTIWEMELRFPPNDDIVIYVEKVYVQCAQKKKCSSWRYLICFIFCKQHCNCNRYWQHFSIQNANTFPSFTSKNRLDFLPLFSFFVLHYDYKIISIIPPCTNSLILVTWLIVLGGKPHLNGLYHQLTIVCMICIWTGHLSVGFI